MSYSFFREVQKYWDFDRDTLPSMGYWVNINDLKQRYSFAVPTDESVRRIAYYSPIVEIGAGLGYWASLLDEVGCDIIAYDTHPGAENHWIEDDYSPWFEVKECSPDFVPPADRALFLCWPPYDITMASDVLSRYKGDTLIYIGESKDGCCADDAFFEALNNWDCIEYIDLPQLFGIRDSLTIYNRLKK